MQSSPSRKFDHESHSSSPAAPSTSRRSFLAAAGALGAALASGVGSALGRDYGPDAPPVRYPDPDIVGLDKRFDSIKLGNTPIERLYTGGLWMEGPAWNAVGKYLVWSDIPNDRQMRWLDEDGHVSIFRKVAFNSNGNTFDFVGRQLSCEHGTRKVVRYEHDGLKTTLADTYNGKRLNAPNDIVVHPDGGIWFTDPGYGSMGDYEGNKGPLELKEAVYRIDPKTGAVVKVTDDVVKPNGLCFSPDYKLLYIADSGTREAAQALKVHSVVDDVKLGPGKGFGSMQLDDKVGVADGIRCDVEGNLWVGAGWIGDGYDGVHIFAPDGDRIGLIRLPEICGNVCFGGPKRNRLFMTAGRSIYSVYVGARGAHIA